MSLFYLRCPTAYGRTEAALGLGARADADGVTAQVNVTLLDHTDRLARLEAAVGLPRVDG